MSNVDSTIFPPRYVNVDIVIRHVLPERVLRITVIGVDEYAVRVWYEITPALDPQRWGDPDWNDTAWAARNTWSLTGRDDRGNLYHEHGGAYGVVAHGQRTEGVRSLQPVPVADASWLELAFHPFDDIPRFERPGHVLRVNLPLEVIEVALPPEWP